MKLDNDIHNYYEHLVLEKIKEMRLDEKHDADYMSDLYCVVLNQLPPRYIRFEVDMAFYMPPSERLAMEMKVAEAINKAQQFLQKRYHGRNAKALED